LQEAKTIDHLLLSCSISRSIWFQVLSGLGRPDLTPDADASLVDWWIRVATTYPTKLTRKICSILLLVFRSIWLERNSRIFKLKSHSIEFILDSIIEEAKRWKTVGFLWAVHLCCNRHHCWFCVCCGLCNSLFLSIKKKVCFLAWSSKKWPTDSLVDFLEFFFYLWCPLVWITKNNMWRTISIGDINT
jgi:hypothetical protein